MVRKLVVVLLSGVFFLLGVTSALAVKYNEAPMLRTMVAAAELPPVEERLPDEPLVVEPIEKIGQYGGTLYTSCINVKTWMDIEEVKGRALLFRPGPDLTSVESHIAKGFEFSEDKKMLTVHLRKGLKWSDGYPFTADDLLFQWEAVLQNKELNPSGIFWIVPMLNKVEKVDDYTVKYYFTEPAPFAINGMALFGKGQETYYLPKHYLKKFHIQYNPEADTLAKKEGFDHWWQCFNSHNSIMAKNDTDLPTLEPWVLKEVTTSYVVSERNPYFYQVDSAGNQLPYIDKVVGYIVGDIEVMTMKVIAGELSIAVRDLSVLDYPLYKKNETKGGYHVLLWKDCVSTIAAFGFNQTYEDDLFLRDIFRDIRFRRAMSLAINREGINDSVFFGKGEPRQYTCYPTCSFYEEKWAKAYAEYDPEKANLLLDEIGLKWDKDHKYRLRTDGKTLSLVVPVVTGGGRPQMPIAELVKEYWEDVGVKIMLKPMDRPSWVPRVEANKVQVNVFYADFLTEIFMQALPVRLNGFWAFNSWGPLWTTWFTTNGEEGEEPPQVMKNLIELIDKWQTTAPGEEEYMQLIKKILDLHAENLWLIGTVGPTPLPMIVDDDLRNLPEGGHVMGSDVAWFTPYLHAQWFFEEG